MVLMYVAILAGVLLLWNTWIVYPLRLLVVFFHELSHGLAAIVTGGRVIEIQLDPREGGLAVTQGGSPLLIASAGYLGSLIIGGTTLLAPGLLFNAAVTVGLTDDAEDFGISVSLPFRFDRPLY